MSLFLEKEWFVFKPNTHTNRHTQTTLCCLTVSLTTTYGTKRAKLYSSELPTPTYASGPKEITALAVT